LDIPASTAITSYKNFSVTFASATMDNFVNIYASSRTIPTPLNSDSGYGNSSLTVTLLNDKFRPGTTWYFRVNSNADNNNVTISNFTKGDGAPSIMSEHTISADTGFRQDKIRSGAPKYYSYANNGSLYVTVKSADVTLYAGFNRIPTPGTGTTFVNYDVTGCNINNCTAYKNIKGLRLSATNKTGTWFIAVTSGAATEIEYMIWFNYECPLNCSSPNGNCKTSFTEYGTCQCGGNFEGLACADDNMLIEYIILIIIAALVLVSALLGLIAWAYMRRRSQYVEVK